MRHYEGIADKLKISNLYFMIFIVQRNKLPGAHIKNNFNNIRRLRNFSTAVKSILCPSDTLIKISNKLCVIYDLVTC